MNRTSHFEVHLTLAIHRDADIKRLATWAAAVGAKVSHIVLDRGDHSSQPMVTLWFTGTFKDVQAAMKSTSCELKTVGFDVLREKIEVEWDSHLVPQSNSDSDHLDANTYFEFHIKLRLRSADLEKLLRQVEGKKARMSSNARRISTDEFQERFVTQRCFGVPQSVASKVLEHLVARLVSPCWEVVEIEKEFVVFDSNLSLDHGWMSTSQGANHVE